MNDQNHAGSARTAVFVAVAAIWIVTAIYDVPLRFSSPAQPLALVAVIGAVGTFGLSRMSVEDVLHQQRAVVGGIAALMVYALMMTLAPWLMASASALLGAAGIAVLISIPRNRVPPRLALIGLAYVIARGVAFFATTFWRGVQ